LNRYFKDELNYSVTNLRQNIQEWEKLQAESLAKEEANKKKDEVAKK